MIQQAQREKIVLALVVLCRSEQMRPSLREYRSFDVSTQTIIDFESCQLVRQAVPRQDCPSFGPLPAPIASAIPSDSFQSC